MNPVQELKTRAEILHHRIQAGDRYAIGRLRVLPAFRKSSYEDLAAAPPAIRRNDCLTVIARELGFTGWTHALSVITADGPIEDFGALLYPKCSAGLNLWYKTYEEAAQVRSEKGGYLLAYRKHYLVVEHMHIEALGLDPADPDWEAIGFDWVRPLDLDARARLYAKVVAALPRRAQ